MAVDYGEKNISWIWNRNLKLDVRRLTLKTRKYIMQLIIGNKNYSSWSLRPWIFMRTLKIDFDEIRIALYNNDAATRLSRYFSGGKVPVLVDGDTVIWDSLAILEYLSETYLAGKGWPVDPGKRAFARSISAEMHSSFQSLRSELPMNCRRNSTGKSLSMDVQRDIDRIISIWEKCRSENSGDGAWLFGAYSIADAMYAPVVLRFNTYGVPLNGVLQDYGRHVLNQPELLEWIEAARSETEVLAKFEV